MATTAIADEIEAITGVGTADSSFLVSAQKFVVASVPKNLLKWAATLTNPSSDGGNTTFSYGGKDYVAGGGEGNRGGNLGLANKDGTGGAGDCDGGSTCTATAGNNGTAYNDSGSTTPGGN